MILFAHVECYFSYQGYVCVCALRLGPTLWSCLALAMVSMEVTYVFKYGDKVWKVLPSDMITEGVECPLVRLSSRGLGRLCFEEPPSKWVTRSAGMRQLLSCRNMAAVDDLAAKAAVLAVPSPAAKRPRVRRLEMATRRLEKTTMSVEMPMVDLPNGEHIDGCVLKVMKPMHPTDAFFVEASAAAVQYCVKVISCMGLSDDECRSDLPKGCTCTGKRFIFRGTVASRTYYKTFPFNDTDESKAKARADMIAYINAV